MFNFDIFLLAKSNISHPSMNPPGAQSTPPPPSLLLFCRRFWKIYILGRCMGWPPILILENNNLALLKNQKKHNPVYISHLTEPSILGFVLSLLLTHLLFFSVFQPHFLTLKLFPPLSICYFVSRTFTGENFGNKDF